MMTKEKSTKVVNFMTPGAGVLVLWHGHIVEIQYFVSKIVNFINPGDGFLCKGVAILVIIVYMDIFYSTIYNTLVIIVLGDYDAAFLCNR